MTFVRRDPPTDPRIAIAFVLCFTVLVAVSHSWWTLSAAVLFATVLIVSAPVGSRVIATRLRTLAPILALVWLFLPWTWLWPSGELSPTVFLSQVGVEFASRITVRACVIVLVVACVLEPLGTARMAWGLRGLGASERFSRLFAMTIRFLPLMQEEFARLRIAMCARGGRLRASAADYRMLATSMGMLLIRSIDRADRVRQAMEARSFGIPPTRVAHQLSTRDLWILFAAFLAIAALVALEYVASRD